MACRSHPIGYICNVFIKAEITSEYKLFTSTDVENPLSQNTWSDLQEEELVKVWSYHYLAVPLMWYLMLFVHVNFNDLRFPFCLFTHANNRPLLCTCFSSCFVISLMSLHLFPSPIVTATVFHCKHRCVWVGCEVVLTHLVTFASSSIFCAMYWLIRLLKRLYIHASKKQR